MTEQVMVIRYQPMVPAMKSLNEDADLAPRTSGSAGRFGEVFGAAARTEAEGTTPDAGKKFPSAQGSDPAGVPQSLRKALVAMRQEQRLMEVLLRFGAGVSSNASSSPSDIAPAGTVGSSAETWAMPSSEVRSPEATSASAEQAADESLGELSKAFESGSKGPGAVGYDPSGGTSYGTYQIASRPGSMDDFLHFLDSRHPEWAAKLRSAGPANTGSTHGGMPAQWRRIAAAHPQEFEAVQREFIEATYYRPAAQKIQAELGIDVSSRSQALKEVVWSTAVQHGAAGAVRIFAKVARNLGNQAQDQDLIASVYGARGRAFRSSPASVQVAVRDRLAAEQNMALAMLENQDVSSLA